jgi:L-alanine-DL-glutamate epimerase-like enolase superfamily enzyme
MHLTEWSTHPVHLRYPREIHWASTEEDGADYVLLRLVTDDGLVGVAEGSAKPAWNSVTPRALSVIIEEIYIPLLRGVDLLDEMAVARALNKVREQRVARSMVETACWDLRAQARGQPMWQLWGGDAAVPVSWTVTRQRPALMAEDAGAMVGRHGFRTLKVKTGQSREIDRAALTEIRAAVGPDVQLMVDANRGYREHEALDYLKELADLGVTVAEDPCQLRPNRAFQELQEASPIPILVDNGCRSEEDAALLLEHGARALSIKTGGTGIGEAQRMAELAHAQDCAAHIGNVGDASLGALVALQIQSALPTRHYSLPAEASFFLMFAEEYVIEPLRVENGQVRLPAAPGHARWVDWERVDALKLD